MTAHAMYSSSEVLLNFQSLLDSLDFSAQLQDLGYGRLSPLKRRAALREFTAVSIGLWKLALERSFPVEHAEYFDQFLRSSPSLNGGKEQSRTLQRIEPYMELLTIKKDADFLPAAQFLLDSLQMEVMERKSLELKISLFIRNLYNLIFSKLI